MPRLLPLAACLLAFSGDVVLDDMDDLHFTSPAGKAQQELVEGRSGKAVQFRFDKDARGVFFTKRLRPTQDWDDADGFSFWVKGDGSDALGGLEFIYADDYAVRYDVAFPIKGRDWQKVTIAWRDLIPVLPGPNAKPLDPATGNKPSKLTALFVGKWWYWGDYPAESFAIDDLGLEPKIDRDAADHRPDGPPLRRVYEKLTAGQPVTIVTMGDSLTDTRHWANREVAWPALLRDLIKAKYGSEVTIVNPAIGGTQLRQNLVLIPRWLEKAPEPDLVTVCFGGNDREAGMTGPEFRASNADAIDRLRRATCGKADVLILATVPSAAHPGATDELAEACRQAAKDQNAGLADTAAAFTTESAPNLDRLYVNDRVHLSRAGHELVARTVLETIEAAGKAAP